jgi:hypothetical protein
LQAKDETERKPAASSSFDETIDQILRLSDGNCHGYSGYCCSGAYVARGGIWEASGRYSRQPPRFKTCGRIVAERPERQRAVEVVTDEPDVGKDRGGWSEPGEIPSSQAFFVQGSLKCVWRDSTNPQSVDADLLLTRRGFASVTHVR